MEITNIIIFLLAASILFEIYLYKNSMKHLKSYKGLSKLTKMVNDINFNKEEKELFQAKMRQAKCKSMNHFLRKCVLEKEIYTVDLKPFNELQGLLANATNNINQIAKRVNSTGIIYKDDINDMREEIEQFSKELWQIHTLLLDRTRKNEDN